MRYALLYHPRTFHEKNYRYFYVPYSIVSIASALDGLVPCVLYDNNILRCYDPGTLRLPDPSEWGLVCVSTMVGMQISDGLRFSQHVKALRPDCPVVWGGACPTLLPEIVLRDAPVDCVVVGQGEVTATALWSAYAASLPLRGVSGVAFVEEGRFVRTEPRPLKNLDKLPPYRDFYGRIGVEQYIRNDEHIGSRTLNYHSSQGCAFRCGFCCEPVLWSNRWTAMSASRIVDDLSPLVSNYGVNGIKFYDSEFFISKDRVLEFAQEVIRQGWDIRWGASVHPRNILRFSREEFALLKKSGLARLLMGAETASESELRLINKRLDRDMVRKAGKICGQFGVSASFTFVTGYPGSPPSCIDDTLAFAEELVQGSSLYEAKVHFYGPYPGTPLYGMAIEHGFSPPMSLLDWARYDYYYVNTPWVPDGYLERVRAFNEAHYPYLVGEEMA